MIKIGFVIMLLCANHPLSASAEPATASKLAEAMLASGIVDVETVNVAEVLADVKVPKAACVAVIVVVPAPTTVTVEPLMVATVSLLLVYENEPALFDVGGVKSKGGLAVIFDGTKNIAKNLYLF